MSDLPLLQNMPVSKFKMYEKNARTHSSEQIQQIAKSIQEFGFLNPILVGVDNVILAGHGRLEAAKLLNLDTVPALLIGHLTPQQAKAYILADNKIALNAGWDVDLLTAELESLRVEDFDLDLIGFSDEELEKLLDQDLEEEDAAAGGDTADEQEDFKISVGYYSFRISKAEFLEWERSIVANVGAEEDDILDEIRNRLDI